jgi:hypothetical protein
LAEVEMIEQIAFPPAAKRHDSLLPNLLKSLLTTKCTKDAKVLDE